MNNIVYNDKSTVNIIALTKGEIYNLEIKVFKINPGFEYFNR